MMRLILAIALALPLAAQTPTIREVSAGVSIDDLPAERSRWSARARAGATRLEDEPAFTGAIAAGRRF